MLLRYVGRSTPGFYSRTLILPCVYKYLTEKLKCNVKLFADDTSLFTVVFELSQWAHDWGMSFNPDPKKQDMELIFL